MPSLDASHYTATEHLSDGSRIEIRALKPEDRDDMLAAVGQTSSDSIYRRFFGPKKGFSEKEIAFYTEVDFTQHVALVATEQKDGRTTIVGGARYIVTAPGQGELAFVVVDSCQGRGIGARLMRHLAVIGRAAGLRAFVADVLPENTSMLKVFEKSGLTPQTRREMGVVHVTMALN